MSIEGGIWQRKCSHISRIKRIYITHFADIKRNDQVHSRW